MRGAVLFVRTEAALTGLNGSSWCQPRPDRCSVPRRCETLRVSGCSSLQTGYFPGLQCHQCLQGKCCWYCRWSVDSHTKERENAILSGCSSIFVLLQKWLHEFECGCIFFVSEKPGWTMNYSSDFVKCTAFLLTMTGRTINEMISRIYCIS